RPLAAALEDYRQKDFPAAQRKWERGLTPAQAAALPAKVREALAAAPANRSAAQQKVLAAHYAKIDPRMVKLTRALAAHDKAAPRGRRRRGGAGPRAGGGGRPTRGRARGDFRRRGAGGGAGVPAVFPPLRAVSSAKGPTRLDLARWIASPENPLTGRVLVNWV